MANDRFRRVGLLAAWLAAAVASGAAAAPVKAPHVSVELVAESVTLKPGADHWIGVRLDLEKHWHVYWKNPGDSGLPVSVKWTLPAGFTIGDLVWPAPDRIEEGPLVSYGHSGSILLMAKLRVPATAVAGGTVKLGATVKWLVCKDTCIPGTAEVATVLPVGDGKPGVHAGRFAVARAAQPAGVPMEWGVSTRTTGRVLSFLISGSHLKGSAYFFPEQPDLIDHAAPQKLTVNEGLAQLDLALSDRFTGRPGAVPGVLKSGRQAWAVELPPPSGADTGDRRPASRAPQGALSDFLMAALFAFLGGMILNLMPCVFPVLSIKILGFVRESGSHPHEVRIHGLLYGAGVVVSFWALAAALFVLKAGGERLGWGFQLQSPSVILVITMVLFLLSLNLLGVFEAGTTIARVAGSARWGEGRTAAFFTGVLATFLATPCTAPFMGTAVGYAAVQPVHVGLAVFTALALGMAAPYVVLSFVPHLGALLPRPGRWMETFKQAMAFPLLATVLWLVWVLGMQAGLQVVIVTLGGLLLIGIAGWIYGRWRSAATRMVVGAVIAVAIGMSLAALRGAAPEASAARGGWAPWSEEAVAGARKAGHPVFVDFTAAWCLTCKVNETVALQTREVRRAFADRGIVLLKADWTNPDPAIERALAAFGRNGVPLYVLYPADPASAPVILPQILTPGLVLSAIDRLTAH